ncbi:MAG: DUF87 domain-containing protein, partial [Candidatus Nealsonbacteria bacterium]|nr:DUF87 domain-containing protein [Candidatus Nealsonbacteria bacterium]
MGKKKKKRKKEKNNRPKKKVFSFFPLKEKTKRNIWSGMLFFLAFVFILSFFDKAAIVGRVLFEIFSFLIGKTVFLLPLVLIMASAALVFAKYKNIYRAVSLGGLFFVVSISGILQAMQQRGLFENDSFINAGEKAGGWLGYLFTWPLFKLVGFWVSSIILALMSFGGVYVFWRLLKPAREEKQPAPEKKEKPSLVKKIFSPSFKVKEVEPAPSFVGQASEEKKEPVSGGKDSSGEKEQKEGKSSWQEEYKRPPLKLLKDPKGKSSGGNIKENSTIIKKTLQSFDIPVEMSGVKVGPTVTQYALKPAEGIKLSKITSLSDDLALALATHPIRIEAPIPGKSLVGIEVPNKVRSFVRLKEMFENPQFQESSEDLLFCLGQDVSGQPAYANLENMPHLLVAGATGSGKTIFLNTLILSLVYRNSPEMLKLLVIDPKRVEFSVYKNLPHLLCSPVIDSQRAVNGFKW